MEKLKKGGFFSIDALFALIILLLMLGPMFNLYQARRNTVGETGVKLKGKMLSQRLAGAVNVVLATGRPLSLRLNLPDNISGENYSPLFDANRRTIYENFENLRVSKASTSASVAVNKIENIENIDPKERIKIYWNGENIAVMNT